ncbi:cytochrome c biogenesis protein ResB [Paenibacillus sp. PAMC21692]|uniref:cytochrome c biogenesis protein ResB n=1 Tax=Paenibacillus sp. PAMC21692 TaxID=2762320 RepID=UPI00164E8E64|nr:cytochrome c biogenesis protein ResB [Paenibacillus sp. PAMC21692]QNK55403.1 cytochrome c biogenesis protein ResB [Paenibacillus sp. PAMC21692]
MLVPENTKCECGHHNSVGTVLCEYCGKPLHQDLQKSDEPLEMRYDGVARRSQKSNPSYIDRVWNFFSSVKIAIYLIVITFLTAMLGTIYPQESSFINNFDPSTYYRETYGTMGHLYYVLGLSHTYESWWFIGLLVMIGTSLVICSLDRVLPLYRALNKQQIRKHHQFLLRQKAVYKGTLNQDAAEWVSQYGDALKKKGYRIHREESGTALLAEKNRFSRWGPYINHIGLILFLLAIVARAIPGWQMDAYVTIPDGDTVQIKDTNYYVKNEKFNVEFYADDELPEQLQGKARAKKYLTEAVMYKCVSDCGDPLKEPVLEEVKRHDIIVNSPLSYDGIKLFQFDFNLNPRLNAVNPVLEDKTTGEIYGPFYLPMKDAELHHELGPFTLDLYANYMEFALGSDGKPTTLSRDPNAPAFVFTVKGPGLNPDGEPYIYFPMQKDKVRFAQDTINRDLAERIEIRVDGMENVDFSEATTVLNVRVDRAVPYLWVGAVFSMLGLIMGSYWQHRRIWLRVDGSEVVLGAHTNKNWFGMRSDVAFGLKKTGIEVDPKSLDNGGKNA